MNQKILVQMLSPLSDSALPLSDQLDLALQALAWARLSQGQTLPEHLRLNSSLLSDPARLVAVFSELAAADGLMGQAFASSGQVNWDSTAVRTTLDLALRLAEAGVLERFDASNAVSLLPPHQSGGWSLPSEVASLLVDFANLSSEETAYLGWDFGGQLATNVAAIGATAAIESPVRSAIPALVSLLQGASFDIRFGDPIRAPSFVAKGALKKFDVAVAFPPMGKRYDLDVADSDLFGRFHERTPSGSVLAVRHLLAHAKRRVVVAVPNNLTFGAGAELSLRKELVSRGMVRSVITVPAGLLDGTGLAFTILVLQTSGGLESIQFVDLKDSRFLARTSKARFSLAYANELIDLVEQQMESEVSRTVPIREVLASDAELQANRFLIPESVRELQAKLAEAATIALNEVVTTVRPMSISKDGMGVEAGEIGAADIPTHGYIKGPGRTVSVDPSEKNRHNFLRPHDIVLIVKGSVGKVGIVPGDVPPAGPGGWVAGQSAIVLRVFNDRIDPRALALQLRSDFGQRLLAQLVKGASIPLIQIRELMQLDVLVPDDRNNAAAVTALEKESELQQQIIELQNKLAEIAADLWPFAN